MRSEGRAPRSEKLAALEAFLGELVTSPEADWFPWACSIAEAVVDQNNRLVIRMPLFRRAIFPALLAGFRLGAHGCARWLAGLAQLLYRCDECREQLDPMCQTEAGLLRAALRHDPNDQASRRRLISVQADRLRYTLHELPSGVLYGIDGATAQECLELEEELAEFCRHVAEAERQAEFTILIDECRLHFRAYRDYLLRRDEFDSYSGYLAHADAGQRVSQGGPAS